MIAAAPRIHLGVAFPAIPCEPVQPVFALEAEAYLPRGYRLADEPAGLQLVRSCDGARLGTMVSEEMACRHAAALERMAAMSGAQAREDQG